MMIESAEITMNYHRYVHRLILNKQDGKVVEFPHPHTAISGERSQVHCISASELTTVVFIPSFFSTA